MKKNLISEDKSQKAYIAEHAADPRSVEFSRKQWEIIADAFARYLDFDSCTCSAPFHHEPVRDLQTFIIVAVLNFAGEGVE